MYKLINTYKRKSLIQKIDLITYAIAVFAFSVAIGLSIYHSNVL